MSLLEDVFLGDEAGEAQELERIVEGDEFDDERRRDDDDDDGGGGEDEAEEDKRRVDPTKEAKATRAKNPRFVLNPARLTGPRGIQVIPEHFKEFRFKGKGHEKEDLDLVLKKLEHWAYRLYPKFKFTDCLKKMETLGKKRVVMVTLNKIRNGQYLTEETVVQKESSDEEATPVVPEEDEFDKLLQQQIEIARQTPGHHSGHKPLGTPAREIGTPFTMPKATSSPSISDEQKERIMRNRRLAEERRLARIKQNSAVANVSNGQFDTINEESNGNDNDVEVTGNVTNNDKVVHVDLTGNMANEVRNKNNRSNVTDSSDESDVETMTESVAVDVHKSVNVGITSNNEDYDTNEDGEKIVDLTGIIETRTSNEVVDIEDIPTIGGRKYNKSNVIDSSDEECEVQAMNESVRVDIHNSMNEETDMKMVSNDDKVNTNETVVPSNDITENGITSNGEPQEIENTETNTKKDDDEKATSVDNKANSDNHIEVINTEKPNAEDDVMVMDVDFSDDF